MKKNFLLLISLLFIYFIAKAEDMQKYCMVPPFIGQAVSPNVLVVIDASGSMSWCAYNPQSNKTDCCNSSGGCGWTYQGNEEGYFDPDKVYEYKRITVGSSRNVYAWVESTSTSYSNCPKTPSGINTSNKYKGSCLNFHYMRRIDLVRWALTGGTLDSCDTGVNINNPQFNRCNPMAYGQSGDQTSCNATGCILKTYGGEKVFARWDRINGDNGGLLFQLKKFTLQPRFGVMEFSDRGNTTFIRQSKVYIGDFTGSANYDAANPYKNTITAINAEDPSGGTPTGPALWDAYNYFSQNTPQYGGFQPDTSSQGNPWKNPMYQCFDDNKDGNCQGNEFKLVPCAKNFIILLTDGQWNTGYDGATTCTIDYGYENKSADPVVPAYWLHKKGFTNSVTNLQSYVEAIYGIGLWLGGTGEKSLKNVAMYGSFDRTKSWPDNLSGYPQNTCGPVDDCCTDSNCGKGSSCTNLPASSPDWDKDGNGIPDTFYSASNAIEIKNAILDAILDILRRASSGATVATLGSKSAISSVILQPIFYPEITDSSGSKVSWIGNLKSYWIDPKHDMREDTVDPKNLNLSLTNLDRKFQMYYDTTNNETKAAILDENSCSLISTKSLQDIKTVYDLGCQLCDNNNRNIFYNKDGSLTQFTTDSENTDYLKPIWVNIDSTIDDTKTNCIIRYLRGEDLSTDNNCKNYTYTQRNRKINIQNLCGQNQTKLWKLGDIIYSTPAIAGNDKLRNYDIRYGDNTYYEYINDDSYKNRKSILAVNANDGMLHIFRAGTIKENNNPDMPVSLINSPNDTSNNLIGAEEFAFIPKNALPYLIWYGSNDYCHIPTTDSRLMIFDASINGNPTDQKSKDSWRTILIGTMGFGGKAILNNQYSSSIFALDLTDWLSGNSTTPSLLWEINLPDKTLTLNFPSVIRIGDPNKNGNWYVVIGSGPLDLEELGDKDEHYLPNPKLYFINLKTGNIEKIIDIEINNNLNNPNYFAAVGDTMPVDVDNDYQDDVIYFGLYGKYKSGNNNYNFGKFYRLNLKNSTGGYKDIPSLTTNDLSEAINMNDFSTNNNIPPVFGAPNFTKDENGKLWVFLGTGKLLTSNDKNINYKNYLIGFKDDCWDGSCNTTYNKSNLTETTNATVQATVMQTDTICICSSNGCSNQTVVVATKDWNSADLTEVNRGWYITLNGEASYSQAAVFGGIVDFITYIPPGDICAYEGNSNLYALYYKSGKAYPNPSIIAPGAVSSTTVGQTATIYNKISLGRGIPPIGNPFQIMSSSLAPSSKYEKYIQVSTGVIIKQQQQAVPPSQGRFILWIEK